jgi:hypothetical protein
MTLTVQGGKLDRFVPETRLSAGTVAIAGLKLQNVSGACCSDARWDPPGSGLVAVSAPAMGGDSIRRR